MKFILINLPLILKLDRVKRDQLLSYQFLHFLFALKIFVTFKIGKFNEMNVLLTVTVT